MNIIHKKEYLLLIYPIIFFIISYIILISADDMNMLVNNIAIKQLLFYLIGFFFIFLINKIGNKFLIRYNLLIYIILNILLFGLLFVEPINNARCWYKIWGFGTFQVSEFMKISIIIMISSYLSNIKYYKNNKYDLKCITNVFSIILIPSLLTFLEPDTGAILMYIIISISILYTAKISYKWFFIGTLILFQLIFLMLFLYKYEINILTSLFGSSLFLRIERIINWKNSSGMQLENSLIAIGSAGIFGNGYKKNKIYYPESHTDFIFTTISSNFGFIGSTILIIFIIIFDLNIIKIIKNSTTKINRYISTGILSVLLYQQIQNISMTMGLLPITGITLPFISYGGSSLLSYMIMYGILINIEKQNKKHQY